MVTPGAARPECAHVQFCAQADGVLREFVKIMRSYRGLVAAGMGGMLSARALRMRVLEAQLGKEARGYPFGELAGGLLPT